jgi:glycosyltransferase involved in cell wall biosynthesis
VRVLLVNDYGTASGGAELGMLLLREALRRAGHDARLLSSTARPLGLPSEADDHCLGALGRVGTVLQVVNPWAYRALRRAIDGFRPDVVHLRVVLTQLSPVILPLLAEVPANYHAVWYRAVCPLGTKLLPDGTPCTVTYGPACRRNRCLSGRRWMLMMLQMRLWERWRGCLTSVTACSAMVAGELASALGRPVGAVSGFVPFRAPRTALRDPPTVAFAGRLVREKGVDVLLQAFAQSVEAVPEARLLIAGDGPEAMPLRSLAQALGLGGRVTFTGHLSREQLERAFDVAWVQAVPSAWAEPFGYVAAEALMRGTAVVVSHTGGLPEIVTEGVSGYLVPPGDPSPVAEAVSKLLADRDLAERMGAAGRQDALERFAPPSGLARWLEQYAKTMEAWRNAAHGG